MWNLERSAVGMVLLGCAAVVVGQTGSGHACYFLQRTGCTGTSGFCKDNQIVCDEGYSSTTQTSQKGKRGPMSGSTQRKCYKLSGGTITGPCTEPAPSGYEPTFCRNSSGVCCFAKHVEAVNPSPGGDMSTPAGNECDFGTVGF
jgi:hypothetical protein